MFEYLGPEQACLNILDRNKRGKKFRVRGGDQIHLIDERSFISNRDITNHSEFNFFIVYNGVPLYRGSDTYMRREIRIFKIVLYSDILLYRELIGICYIGVRYIKDLFAYTFNNTVDLSL